MWDEGNGEYGKKSSFFHDSFLIIVIAEIITLKGINWGQALFADG